MTITTTWKHNFTNYSNLDNINQTGKQTLEIFQPLAAKKIRLQLNNLYDEIPLKISSLTVATSEEKKAVTYSGRKNFLIEPRLMGWSDWIDLNLDSNQFIKITIASPNKTIHSLGLTISNDLIKTKQTDPLEPKYFFGVSSIQVQTEKIYPKLAFFGDSLTNQGNFSAPLALELESNFNIMTANFGISGNRLLHPGHSTSKWSNSFGEAGFTRFDHMLDYQPNIIIFMEGINDFLHPGTGTPVNELPTANALSSAIIELKKRAKQHKTIFIPMTITPAEGNINGGVYAWSFEKEKLRLETNETLLKLPNVIDLANFVGKNGQLISTFDCGDHVHFSQAGGKIVADFIKEQLIRKKLI